MGMASSSPPRNLSHHSFTFKEITPEFSRLTITSVWQWLGFCPTRAHWLSTVARAPPTSAASSADQSPSKSSVTMSPPTYTPTHATDLSDHLVAPCSYRAILTARPSYGRSTPLVLLLDIRAPQRAKRKTTPRQKLKSSILKISQLTRP